MSTAAPRAGLVTAGETMGLVIQAAPGSMRNGEPMSFGIGGSESNVAIGVRRLGVLATWIGRVGADPPGDLIRRELRAERVDVIAGTDPAPTGLMIRWRPTAMHARVTYHRRHSAGSQLRAADIPDHAVRAPAVFHATGITLALGNGPAAAVTHAIAVARAAGTVVSFDLNYRRALWPESEAAPALVLIKLGAAGCLARIDGATYELSAPAVTVLDTVGAGDAFVAGYLAELMEGAGPERRLATAVAAGAFAVSVSGDWEGLPDRRALELLEAIEPVIR